MENSLNIRDDYFLIMGVDLNSCPPIKEWSGTKDKEKLNLRIDFFLIAISDICSSVSQIVKAEMQSNEMCT